MYRLSTLRRSGFTLIELIVAIGIISILAGVLFSGFTDARAQARDRTRMASLKEMQLALELYKAQNGRYPEQGCGAVGVYCGIGGDDKTLLQECSAVSGCTQYILGATGRFFVPEFMPSLALDPLHDTRTPFTINAGFYYRTDAAGTAYKLMVMNAMETMTLTAGAEFAVCPTTTTCTATTATVGAVYGTTIAVYSAGAETW